MILIIFENCFCQCNFSCYFLYGILFYPFDEIQIICFHKTPLHIAIDTGNLDIIKLLISCDRIDVNLYSI